MHSLVKADDNPGGDPGPATQFKDIVTRLAEHRVSATKRRRLERD